MSKAQLVNINTGQVFEVPKMCTIGRSDDNQICIAERSVSRHHCLIQRGLLGGWFLKQLGETSIAGKSSSSTTVRRQGKVIYLRPGKAWRLAAGDTFAFGKPSGEETVIFSHEFRIVQ